MRELVAKAKEAFRCSINWGRAKITVIRRGLRNSLVKSKTFLENMPKKIKTTRRKVWKLLKSYEALFVILGVTIFVILILVQRIFRGIDQTEVWDSLFENLPTSIVEVFVLGALVLWYTAATERRTRTRQLKRELAAFRYWKEKEGAYRVAGIIQELSREKIDSFDLHDIYIPKTNMSNAYLQGAFLVKANLKKSYLKDANLQNAVLLGANLNHADLRGANLVGIVLHPFHMSMRIDSNSKVLYSCTESEFERIFNELQQKHGDGVGAIGFGEDRSVIMSPASIKEVKLHGAKVDSLHWVKIIEKLKVPGYEEIVMNYKTIIDYERKRRIYRIVSKNFAGQFNFNPLVK